MVLNNALRPLCSGSASASLLTAINCKKDTAISMPASGTFCVSAISISPPTPRAMLHAIPRAPSPERTSTMTSCCRGSCGNNSRQAAQAITPVTHAG